ncbi:ABC transporter permease [Mycobacterium sp. NAZ190054]|uniref:ABC transporter permease n=1 Tax=Mycobacterium sp. NAZ190054 TaxID=1747766 RepID=UPI000791DA63|nr:ABC transporter permease [Mycobacterium sp. NAZ190054]KWX66126.1 hypothetical protein ASJ79_06635 [Mycobacterium sp. NAZ190054]
MAIAMTGRTVGLWRGLHRHRAGGIALGELAGAALFAALVLAAVCAPILAPYPPTATAGDPFLPPGASYLLGTDGVGYDMASRILYGLRTSLFGAFAVVILSALAGGLVGTIAALGPRWLDTLLMRMTDICMALPAALLAVTVVVAIGPGYLHTLLAVLAVWWPLYARIVRSQLLALQGRPHHDAVLLARVPMVRRTRRHLVPGTYSTVIATMSQDIGAVVITLSDAGLSGSRLTGSSTGTRRDDRTQPALPVQPVVASGGACGRHLRAGVRRQPGR